MTSVTLTLTGIAHGGEAFGRYQGKIVFVPYTIPGETIQAEILQEKARWARARLVEILDPSPDRVQPPCPYFGPGQCGGCQWQHIDYQRQLSLKQEIVSDQLLRLAGVQQPPVMDCIALADDQGLLDLGYRNHVQFTMFPNGSLGFFRDGTGRSEESSGDRRTKRPPTASLPNPGDIIAVERCLLLHPLLQEIHTALTAGIRAPAAPLNTESVKPDRALESREKKSAPAEETLTPGIEPSVVEDPSSNQPTQVRRVSLRAGLNTGQRLLVFDTEKGQAPAFVLEGLATRCAVRHPHGPAQPLIGDPWIEEIVAGRVFRISAESFFQVNSVGAEVLVHLAREMLAPASFETLLDGYCGVGLFALSLADDAGLVIGIEESEIACEDFAWNGRDLDNVALYEGPIADVLASMVSAGPEADSLVERIDIALVDPPRTGMGQKVIQLLAQLEVRRLLVVSCDPATLARDTKHLLEAGYHLHQVQPVDLFPQTYHVESLALFTRSG
jgi:23S rRNA (uracil1939-C5)-methyltransferase